MPELLGTLMGTVTGGAIATITQFLASRWNASSARKHATHLRLLDLYSSFAAVATDDLERAKSQESHIVLWRPGINSDPETNENRKNWLALWNELERKRLPALQQLAKIDTQISMFETDKQLVESIHLFRTKQPCYMLNVLAGNPESDAQFKKATKEYEYILERTTQYVLLKYRPR